MNNIVRALVLVLAVSGAAASALTNHTATSNKVTATKTSSMFIPCCEPDDPNACGWR